MSGEKNMNVQHLPSFNEKFKNEYAKNTYDWECYKTNKNIISHARKAYDNIKKHE